MNRQPDTLGIALDALEKGFAPIPVVAGTKIPAVKWKQWQAMLPPEDLVREWFSVRSNIAVVTSGMVVFDVDDPEKAELVIAECGTTPHMLRTPRGGVHLGYRKRKGSVVSNQVKLKGLPIDIRTDGGLELIADSFTDMGAYTWLQSGLRPISELPVANIGWTREQTKKRVKTVVLDENAEVMVRRARAYVATIEPAVSGQAGHNRTFRVACTLVQKFGLTAEQAWPILVEFGERCQPPWSEGELKHKLEDAVKLKR